MTIDKRILKEYIQVNNAEPSRVFPLLCPVKERDWLQGWESEIIYSRSGVAEPGCVFKTKGPKSTATLWYTTEHDPTTNRIRFLRFTPELEIVRINIDLLGTDDNKTRSTIVYEYSPLTEERWQWLLMQIDKQFESDMIWWESALNHYLETGEMLTK